MLQVDESSNGKTVEIKAGQTLEVLLNENPTTGFRWQRESDTKAAALVLAADSFDPPAGPPGSGGTHRWQFRAEHAGEQTIEFVYGRPWEQKATRKFTLHVRVGS